LGEFVPGHPWDTHFNRQGALAPHLEEEDYFLGAQTLIAEMMRAGVTAFADIHQEPPGAANVTRLIGQAAELSGLRAVLSLEACGFINVGGMKLKHTEEEFERTLGASLAHAREWHGRGGGRLKVMLGLAAPPVPTPRDLARVSQTARDTGLGIQMHVAEIAYEMEEWAALYGVGPAQALREAGMLEHHFLGGNVVFLDEAATAILRDHPFHASTCPQNCCKLTLGMLDIPLMLENGVNVCLGSNEVVNNNNIDLIEEMRFAALYHKMHRRDPAVLWGDEPLRLITERGARALGTGAGVLEAGRPADVILVEATGPHMTPAHDPLANFIYSSAAGDVRTSIVAGRVVMENRRVLTFDAEAVVARLEERLRPLRAHLPPPAQPGPRREPFDLRWEAER
jgi:5-methylthioadenosine/S-adenosylhomocysteine deaminase